MGETFAEKGRGLTAEQEQRRESDDRAQMVDENGREKEAWAAECKEKPGMLRKREEELIKRAFTVP